MRPLRSAIAILLAVPGIAVARKAPVAPVSGVPIRIGAGHAIASTVLGDSRQINVWLPNGYEDKRDRYPVVYLLDGALDQDFAHIAGLGSLGSLSWTFGPVIIVGIQTRDRRAELTPRPTDPRYLSAFPESGGAERFRRFLASEVIPFVERRYRTGARRALMGESLAGLFVVDTLLGQPSLFNDYIAISPSLWWDDRRPLRRPALPPGVTALSNGRLFLAMADEGGTMQDGVDRLRRTLEQLPAETIRVKYVDYSRTATHDTLYHHAAEDALRWLYPAPPYKSGPAPWYMIEGAAPPPAQRP
ncbi:MAG: alpha/beta hydrolase-fold protein [Sphingomonas sp.]